MTDFDYPSSFNPSLGALSDSKLDRSKAFVGTDETRTSHRNIKADPRLPSDCQCAVSGTGFEMSGQSGSINPICHALLVNMYLANKHKSKMCLLG